MFSVPDMYGCFARVLNDREIDNVTLHHELLRRCFQEVLTIFEADFWLFRSNVAQVLARTRESVWTIAADLFVDYVSIRRVFALWNRPRPTHHWEFYRLRPSLWNCSQTFKTPVLRLIQTSLCIQHVTHEHARVCTYGHCKYGEIL